LVLDAVIDERLRASVDARIGQLHLARHNVDEALPLAADYFGSRSATACHALPLRVAARTRRDFVATIDTRNVVSVRTFGSREYHADVVERGAIVLETLPVVFTGDAVEISVAIRATSY